MVRLGLVRYRLGLGYKLYNISLTCASFDLMPVLTALISRPRGPPNSSVVKVVQVVGLSGGPGLKFWIRIKFGSVLIQLFT